MQVTTLHHQLSRVKWCTMRGTESMPARDLDVTTDGSSARPAAPGQVHTRDGPAALARAGHEKTPVIPSYLVGNRQGTFCEFHERYPLCALGTPDP